MKIFNQPSLGRLAAALLGTAALLGGCASHPKVDASIDWNSRIGAYTYDAAVTDLGKPDVLAETREGRSAEWILKRSPRLSFGFGLGQGVYGSQSAVGVGVGTSVSPPPHGEYLRLKFGLDNKLTEWSKVKY